jgi:aminomethyltransferase
MFVNRGADLFVIVNGACKVGDIAHIQARIGQRCDVIPMPERALLACRARRRSPPCRAWCPASRNWCS